VPVAPARELGANFVIAVSVLGNEGQLIAPPCTDSTPAWRRLLSRVWQEPAAATATLEAATGGPDPVSTAGGLASILCKASIVVQTTIAAARLRETPPDFLIAPAACDIGAFEVHRAAEAIEAGRSAARAALPNLFAAIEARRAELRPWWPRAAA
jgi:NTE family protein